MDPVPVTPAPGDMMSASQPVGGQVLMDVAPVVASLSVPPLAPALENMAMETPEVATLDSVPPRRGRGRPKKDRSQTQCKVDGCDAKICHPSIPKHLQVYNICLGHSRAISVAYNGLEHRYCQTCRKLQLITEFEKTTSSCRTSLLVHKERRRNLRNLQKNGTKSMERTASGILPSHQAIQDAMMRARQPTLSLSLGGPVWPGARVGGSIDVTAAQESLRAAMMNNTQMQQQPGGGGQESLRALLGLINSVDVSAAVTGIQQATGGVQMSAPVAALAPSMPQMGVQTAGVNFPGSLDGLSPQAALAMLQEAVQRAKQSSSAPMFSMPMVSGMLPLTKAQQSSSAPMFSMPMVSGMLPLTKALDQHGCHAGGVGINQLQGGLPSLGQQVEDSQLLLANYLAMNMGGAQARV